MDYSFQFLRETSQLLYEYNSQAGDGPLFRLECTYWGIRMFATYKKGDNHFTQENTTPWMVFKTVGMRSNPLSSAFESLLQAVQEDMANE